MGHHLGSNCIRSPPAKGRIAGYTELARISQRVMRTSSTDACRFRRTGRYGISCRIRGSVRLDAGRLDHLGPLLGLRRHIGAELRGGEDHRRGGRIGEPRLDDRICEPVIDLAVEPLDDLVWRTPRDADTLPRALASKPGTTSLTVGTSGSP